MNNIIKLVSNKDEQERIKDIPANDIPKMLRMLADQIEETNLDESVSDITGCTVVLTDEQEGDLSIFGYGPEADKVQDIYWILSKSLQVLRDSF